MAKRKKEAKPKEPPVVKCVLDGEIENIIDLLIEGKPYREIAEEYKVSLGTVFNYLHKTEHSARVKEALNISASSYDEKAEKVLLDITKESTQVEMQRARELGHHYRWKAAKRSPNDYGERIKQDVTIQTEQPLFPDSKND